MTGRDCEQRMKGQPAGVEGCRCENARPEEGLWGKVYQFQRVCRAEEHRMVRAGEKELESSIDLNFFVAQDPERGSCEKYWEVGIWVQAINGAWEGAYQGA